MGANFPPMVCGLCLYPFLSLDHHVADYYRRFAHCGHIDQVNANFALRVQQNYGDIETGELAWSWVDRYR